MEKMGCYILGKELIRNHNHANSEIDRARIEIDHLKEIERGD